MAGCRPLSDEEIELVLKSFSGRFERRNRLLFLCGTKLGFRISELLSLKLSDVFQHGKALDRITVEAKNMKGGRRGRSVVVHSAAKVALMDYLTEYKNKWDRHPPPEEFLFKSQFGANRHISRSQAAKFLHDIYDSHQFTGKLGTHTMRKCFAQKIWLAVGKDIVKTAAAMGHSNINSTVKYVCNFAQEDIENAILST